ncbi:M18 family aminopeptidase [Ornithinimicrobium sp. INDO-MA30-4]|uniref:M18 family aminopeptidase n=1 Tax=Ornithinimicrobium sp. INDO-MA30-4 TaxID=2908651 RepID=UPI002882F86A|nr:M18 family aminopeptidase [Ornithinimicrobium sp. INDO-MA30-4]
MGDERPSGFRVVGAHTDSPNLRIKPAADAMKSGWHTLGVERYGGALLNSWLDRDLGIAGRAVIRTSHGRIIEQLFNFDEALLRVSQLAIHLDREVATNGLNLNPQQHMAPHWALGPGGPTFLEWLCNELGIATKDLLGWEAMAYDLTPARRLGRDSDLLGSGRLDNLATCYASLVAMERAVAAPTDGIIPLIVMFDHEEIGSVSERGAGSTFLPTWLERIASANGASRDEYFALLAGSVIASGDVTHATHPHYPDRHEPQHNIAMNGGPVLKVNANLRYATDSVGAASFTLACEQAGVPMQTFVTRTDLPSGSTIGPMTAAMTGVTTVDFGAPTLSMHSAREGVAWMTRLATALRCMPSWRLSTPNKQTLPAVTILRSVAAGSLLTSCRGGVGPCRQCP